jgi:hypothetical protein
MCGYAIHEERASSALSASPNPIRWRNVRPEVLQTRRRHRAIRAKIGAKPPLTRNPEQVPTLWITLGMTGITPYCKSCFWKIGAKIGGLTYPPVVQDHAARSLRMDSPSQ